MLGVACQSEGSKTEAANREKAEMDSIFSHLPASAGLVNDFENILDEREEKLLDQHVARINSSTPFEVVIVTSDTLGPFEDIISYATALGNKWSIGDEGQNNGVVILVSSKLGQAAIAPGNEVEDIFNDKVTSRIMDERMFPHFMRSDFYAGLERALREIDRMGSGEN